MAVTICSVVYTGHTYPSLHGTKCVLPTPHPQMKHWGVVDGRSLRWLTEEEKKNWPPKEDDK